MQFQRYAAGSAGAISRMNPTRVTKRMFFMDMNHTFPSMLAKCVEKNPATTAHIIEATGRQISWSEVNETQRELASLLQQTHEVKHGDFVWYMATRQVVEIQAMMASAHCGSIFAPIGIRWPPQQIARYKTLMPPKVAIVEKKYKHILSDMGIPCIVLPDNDEFVKHSSNEFDTLELSPSDTLIMQYTSGTTSLPKLLKHSHQAILYAGKFGLLNTEVPYTPEDKTLMYLRAGAIINPMLYAWNLEYSSALIHQETIDIPEWPRICQQYGVTRLMMFGRAMVQISNMQLELPTLKLSIYSGLPVPTSIVKEVKQLCPNAMFVHGYGMTEAAGPLLYHIYDESEDLKSSTLPLSKSIPGVEWKLGKGNEILARSPAMMDGYHGKENINELFQDGWFHTGDVGKVDKQGLLYIVDRLKDIIISVDGHNTFPIDVEDVLLQHPKVAECAVVGKDLEVGQVPVACIIASDSVSAEELRVLCENNLEPKHIPQEFLFMKDFPKTANNKIQKAELKRLIREEKLYL